MKGRLLLICIILLNFSCSKEDNAGDIMQDLAPTLSVALPENFEYGQEYEIEISYKRPTNCHNFSGLDISQNENEIQIGVVTSYRTSNTNCSTTGNLNATTALNFVAERDDFYIFKFWQGATAGGENRFLTIEVPVTQPGL